MLHFGNLAAHSQPDAQEVLEHTVNECLPLDLEVKSICSVQKRMMLLVSTDACAKQNMYSVINV